MHPMLTTAVKAARRAGNIITRGARDLDLLTVTSKGPKDFVSEVDRAAEAAIVDTLLDAADHSDAALVVSTHDAAVAGRFTELWELHSGLLAAHALEHA